MNGHLNDATLNELADGTLPAEERARAEAHVAECLTCAAAVRDTQALSARARALPRTFAPPAEAWSNVSAATRRSGGRSPLGSRRRWPALAAAAAVLVMASSLATMLVTGRGPQRSATADPAPAAAPAAAATTSLSRFATIEARYVGTADALAAALEEKRTTLQPETIAQVERSLATIDAAIAEARTALAADPANGVLVRLLAASYEQKVALLQRATELPPRS